MFRYCIAAATLSSLAVPATAATFTNGSFEQPGGGPIRRMLDNGDTFVTGWVNSGGYQIYESAGQDAIPAGDGTYYVSFGHVSAVGGTLSQTFDTVVGETYLVNYLLRQQQGVDDAQTMVAEIVGGPSVSNAALAVTDWRAGTTLRFVATAPSTTLRFRDASADGVGRGANFALDAVTVTGAVSAVPEPASWALMIGGIGMIGGAMRRRPLRGGAVA